MKLQRQVQPRRHEGLALRRAAKDRELALLMRAAQDGDRVAYGNLLHELVPLLQRVVGARLRFLQPTDREDLVQDVLLSLHVARATYDPARPFMPWLMSITHNRIVDRARRYARMSANEVLVDEVPATISADEAGTLDREYGDPEALRQAVRGLPSGQRTAIELLKFKEFSLKEASNASGTSIGALKVSAHRAVKSLRNALGSGRPDKGIAAALVDGTAQSSCGTRDDVA